MVRLSNGIRQKKAEPELRLIFSHDLNLLNFQCADNGFCISLRLLLIISR